MTVLSPLERRLRWSGILVIMGLVIEAVCLTWARPLAFIFLVAGGGALCGAGIVLYLFSLVSIVRE